MHPSYILNPKASSADRVELTRELLDKSRTLMNLLLHSCTNAEGEITAPKDLWVDTLWIANEFVTDAQLMLTDESGC